MEHHALEATKGQHYAEMGRFLTPSGESTSDEALAAKGPDGRPVENGLRNIWVTETALTTALNTSFFAERVAVFSIVMGVALLLTGIGFLVLTLGGALGYVAFPSGQQSSTRPRPAAPRRRADSGGPAARRSSPVSSTVAEGALELTFIRWSCTCGSGLGLRTETVVIRGMALGVS